MATIINKPRRTVIVIDEYPSAFPIVSMAIRRECDFEPVLLLNKEPACSQEELFEIIRDKFGMSDALINAL